MSQQVILVVIVGWIYLTEWGLSSLNQGGSPSLESVVSVQGIFGEYPLVICHCLRTDKSPWNEAIIINCLVVWNMNYIFPSYWECHHPNWLSVHHFSEGYRYTMVYQPPVNHRTQKSHDVQRPACPVFFTRSTLTIDPEEERTMVTLW